MDLPHWVTPKGVQTVRVYNNVFGHGDTRRGEAYALEVSLHDVEIDHNYILQRKMGYR